MKKYKHRKTGEIATYKDGVLKSSGFCVEIGVEPSNEFWEEVVELKCGQLVYRIWENGEKSLGIVGINTIKEGFYTNENTKPATHFKALETFLECGTVIKDNIYGLGSYKYKIIEKDYEILSYKFQNSIYTKKFNGLYTDCQTYILENPEKAEIYSVKRLSDGEIFTVGDVCCPNGYIDNDHPITKFELILNNTRLRVASKNWYLGINDIIKSKPVLFTTEDGVDIREGDTVYGIHVSYSHVFSCDNLFQAKKEKWKKFSSRETAQNWLILNKPCLSLQEIKDILYPKSFNRNKSKYDALIELVKSKL